jgi:dipeptidyl aminopeptidase/acylaminoacyl peptidase
VAYVVKAPNLETNRNVYKLYVRGMDDEGRRENGRVVLESQRPLTGLKWADRSEGQKLLVLDQFSDSSAVEEIDPLSGSRKVAVASSIGISSFSSDTSGDLIAYSSTTNTTNPMVRRAYADHGYPVLFEKGIRSPDEALNLNGVVPELFTARRQDSGAFTTMKLEDGALQNLRGVSALSVSPDGRYLVFNYRVVQLPADWESSPLSHDYSSAEILPAALGIFDLQTRSFRVALNSPWAGWELPVTWSADSGAFSVNAVAPVRSEWEAKDRDEGFQDGEQYASFTHTFAVDVLSERVSEVVRAPLNWYISQVSYWQKADGELLLRRDSETFCWMKHTSRGWSEVGESRLSLGRVNVFASIDQVGQNNFSSDGLKVVGALEQTLTPPDLFIHDLKTNETRILTDLNPEWRDIAVQPAEKIDWRDRFGYRCTGILVRPADYDPRKRYPLVILTKVWWDQEFIGDTHYQTAFPPGSLASAGFVVLMANTSRMDLLDHDPALKQFPGKMGEAEEFMAMIESALDALSNRGLIDRSNVGIMGFSHTSWLVDIMLTHSNTPFRAASSADSGLWNYGLYWSANLPVSGAEKFMGGPPYGPTLQNWLRYSPGFNSMNVSTPILMEYTDRSPLNNNIDGLELYVLLRRQKKAADLIFYPGGEHVLDTPFQRVASLQRNVDWFRFWMQNTVRTPPPYDPEQYIRWRSLRDDQKSDETLRP